ncbi:hypothetical protein C8J57DRAFT_1523519 [Mycena rebaudengoi]|nr:hypothetical protein C8J57DRAFT_1523519 [Mycena rebaudengoi]
MLLISLRAVVIPRLSFTAKQLAILDGAAASPFTMEFIGGTFRDSKSTYSV